MRPMSPPTPGLRVGRVLLSSIFVIGGLDAVRNASQKAVLADRVVGPLARLLPGAVKTELVVRADGLAKLVGGLALAAGVRPRLAALGLASSLVPTTLAGHRFWEQTEAPLRAAHQVHFVKNVSLFGALLIVAGSGQGHEAAPGKR